MLVFLNNPFSLLMHFIQRYLTVSVCIFVTVIWNYCQHSKSVVIDLYQLISSEDGVDQKRLALLLYDIIHVSYALASFHYL